MRNISIIGAGQLGSRHLQGLKKADLEMFIYVVDTDSTSLKLAEERYFQVEENPKIVGIKFLSDISLLPDEIDLAILATGSSHRAKITKALIQSKTVKNFVFEKFLFPSISEYEEVLELLIQKGIDAWVNCPRRMFSYYHSLKDLLTNESNVEFTVTGGEWGMACNSIHFIDIFSYLINDSTYNLNTSFIDRDIIESKRLGYIELTGTIVAEFAKNNKIKLIANKNSVDVPVISVTSDGFFIEIDEVKGKMNIKEKGKEEVSLTIQMLYQSQLSGDIAEQILSKGKTNLTSFEESSHLHLQFLEPIVKFYNIKTGNNGDSCPIT